MSSTHAPSSTRRHRRAILPAAMVLGLGLWLLSCVSSVMVGGGAGASGPRLPHAAHLGRELECADCHLMDAVSQEEALAEMFDTCMICHEDIDEEWPAEERLVGTFWSEDHGALWERASRPLSEEVIFSHEFHESLDCTECHAGMLEDRRDLGYVKDMSQCMECHERRQAPNSCATCHERIREDVAPPSHDHLWMRRHGPIACDASAVAEGNCAMCHDGPEWCASCHAEQAPTNHTQLFRSRLHGSMAAMNRMSCAACHRTDFCMRCHEDTPPDSHRGDWSDGARSRHCYHCHFPVQQEEGCRVCHRREPVHLTAVAQPDWHQPSFVCRECHEPFENGIAKRVPHPDMGMACARCHRR